VSRQPSYAEQLRVPLRWWALAVMFWTSVLLAFLVAAPTAFAVLFVGTLSALNVLVFVVYGAARVVVEGGELLAGRARIPVGLLADPEALDTEEARRVAGVDADARAYLLMRPYLRRAVRVRVTDPADPAPYWLVATRHPRTLVAALDGAIAGARGAAPDDGVSLEGHGAD
jgi:hypothetical protein